MNEVVAYKKEYHFEHQYHRWFCFDLLNEDIKLNIPDKAYDEEEIVFDQIVEIERKILMRNISD
jgi:hypothetical protein